MLERLELTRSGFRAGAMRCIAIAASAWVLSSVAIAETAPQDDYDAVALEAYYYLYPLVVVDQTRAQLSNVPPGHPGLAAPMNTFAASRGFPTPEMHSVPRPNFDTLYSPAWVDLTQGPVLMSTPDTGDRYHVITILDMWSEMFASTGTRTTGNAEGHFLITPPDWSGSLPADLPEGVIEIASPTRYAWVIGRIQTNGEKDFAEVHALQDKFALTAFDADGKLLPAKAFKPDTSVDMKTPPNLQVESLQPAEFFETAAELMKLHPPHLIDWPIAQRMSRIGLVPGESYDASAQSAEVQAALNAAPAQALDVLTWKFPRLVTPVNYWSINTEAVGTYGTAYLKRAVIAKFGLGSSAPQDSVYPLAFKDRDGNDFDGNKDYVIHFDKSGLPPVGAFWSIALYDNDGFPIANPLNRYAISSWMPLVYNADGSLDIYIQTDTPGTDKEANWLPALKAGFGLNMRLYAPESEVIAGKWVPPAVQRVEN